MLGKVLGSVRGTFTFANMPLFQQMTLGVLTENGISMNVSPIAAYDESTLSSLMSKGGVGGGRGKQNERITALIEYTEKLKKLDAAGKTQKKMDQKQFNERL